MANRMLMGVGAGAVGGGAAQAQFAQAAAAQSSGAVASLAKAFARNVANHSAIIVAVSGNNTTGGFGVTDSQGNTYTALTALGTRSEESLRLFLGLSTAAGALTVTATPTAGGPCILGIAIMEVIDSTAALDAHSEAIGNNAAPNSGAITLDPTASFVVTDLTDTGIQAGTPETIQYGSGWTPGALLATNGVDTITIGLAYRQNTNGSQTGTWTIAPSMAWVCQIASLIG